LYNQIHSLTGSISTAEQYWAAGSLYVLGAILYGCSYNFYARFIPKLARNHRKVRETAYPKEKAKIIS
jgi:hypothetical protein